jgi:hypothetical protein
LVKGLLADGLRVVPPQDAQTCWSWTWSSWCGGNRGRRVRHVMSHLPPTW